MSLDENPILDKQEMIAFLHMAIKLGITFFNPAEVYGPFTNKVLVGEAVESLRGQIERSYLPSTSHQSILRLYPTPDTKVGFNILSTDSAYSRIRCRSDSIR